MSRHTLPSLMPGHQLRLLQGGDAYFAALVQAIEAAVQEVRLETYIFHDDASGQAVMQALIRAAHRGLGVYVMVDGLGTPALPAHWVAALTEAGGQCLTFRPVRRWGLLMPGQWRRLHRKLVLIDHSMAFCGGINVLDDWVEPGRAPLRAPRFDFAVAVKGPLVADIATAMTTLWWRTRAAQSARAADLRGGWQALQNATSRGVASPLGPSLEAWGDAAPVKAALLLRDNLRHRSQIERAYRKAIGNARQEVLLANAYFLPGRRLREALIHAARRGVRVRLLLLAQFRWPLQAHAVRWVYRPLLAAGVEIHAYTASYLHAKVAVVDGQWATVGSSNLDPLSLLLAREANVVVHDPVFSGQLRESLLQALQKDGQAVREAEDVSLWGRCLDHVAFALLRVLVAIAGRRY